MTLARLFRSLLIASGIHLAASSDSSIPEPKVMITCVGLKDSVVSIRGLESSGNSISLPTASFNQLITLDSLPFMAENNPPTTRVTVINGIVREVSANNGYSKHYSFEESQQGRRLLEVTPPAVADASPALTHPPAAGVAANFTEGMHPDQQSHNSDHRRRLTLTSDPRAVVTSTRSSTQALSGPIATLETQTNAFTGSAPAQLPASAGIATGARPSPALVHNNATTSGLLQRSGTRYSDGKHIWVDYQGWYPNQHWYSKLGREITDDANEKFILQATADGTGPHGIVHKVMIRTARYPHSMLDADTLQQGHGEFKGEAQDVRMQDVPGRHWKIGYVDVFKDPDSPSNFKYGARVVFETEQNYCMRPGEGAFLTATDDGRGLTLRCLPRSLELHNIPLLAVWDLTLTPQDYTWPWWLKALIIVAIVIVVASFVVTGIWATGVLAGGAGTMTGESAAVASVTFTAAEDAGISTAATMGQVGARRVVLETSHEGAELAAAAAELAAEGGAELAFSCGELICRCLVGIAEGLGSLGKRKMTRHLLSPGDNETKTELPEVAAAGQSSRLGRSLLSQDQIDYQQLLNEYQGSNMDQWTFFRLDGIHRMAVYTPHVTLGSFVTGTFALAIANMDLMNDAQKKNAELWRQVSENLFVPFTRD